MEDGRGAGGEKKKNIFCFSSPRTPGDQINYYPKT